MAKTVANIGVSVTARTEKFSRGMRRAQNATRNFQLNVQNLSGAVKQLGLGALLSPFTAMAAGATAAGVAFTRMLRSAEDFNRAMRNSTAIMGDLTDVLRGDMKQAAFDVARITQFSATEAAKAYFFLASAGLTARESIEALPTVAKFAQAGMFDLALATDLLTDAQSALGLSVDNQILNMENMRRVSDVLVKANTLANASVQQFSEALTNKAGAALKILNKDIEEGVAVLAAFADQGIKGAEAGTQFDIVLRNLRIKAVENADAFREFNVRVFDISGNMRHMADILADLEGALSGLGTELQTERLLLLGFTAKTISSLSALLGLSEKIGDFDKALKLAGDTTSRVQSKQLTPLQKGWAQLTATLGEFATKASVVNSALGELATGLSDIIKLPQRLGTILGETLAPLFGGVSKSEMDRTLNVQKRLNQMLAERSRVTKDIATAAGNVADARERAAKATRAERSQGFAKVLDELASDLASFGKTSGQLTIQGLERQGASANVLRLARDLNESLEAAKAQEGIEATIDSLERQQAALTHTTRELALLEAEWQGATRAQLDYIATLHDNIETERKRQEEEKKAIREQEQLSKLVAKAGAVSLARTFIGGLDRKPGSKQAVKDAEALVELRTLVRLAERNQGAVAV